MITFIAMSCRQPPSIPFLHVGLTALSCVSSGNLRASAVLLAHSLGDSLPSFFITHRVDPSSDDVKSFPINALEQGFLPSWEVQGWDGSVVPNQVFWSLLLSSHLGPTHFKREQNGRQEPTMQVLLLPLPRERGSSCVECPLEDPPPTLSCHCVAGC